MYNKNHTKQSTRSENESKDTVTSVRMSKDQKQKIQQKAEKAGMPIGSYMVNVAANGGDKLTPETLVAFQNLINTACDAVKENKPEQAEDMQKGAFKLWQKLI